MADNNPRKKRKLEPTKKHISVEELRQSLQVQNPDGAVEGGLFISSFQNILV